MKRRDFLAGSAACSLAALTGQALAQSGPLTKIIFPFAAGGGGDALCRLLAQHIGPLLDRSVIVENRTGGDGLIGIKAVKGANPDGTTILVTTGPTMYLLPMVETTPSFDAAKNFVPVSQLADHQRSRRRPYAVCDFHVDRCDPAASRGQHQDSRSRQRDAFAVPA